MTKITIDGKEFQAADGKTVIQVGFDNGIFIPHYCWHPGLSPEGNCRMCLVEIEKAPKLMPSCMMAVADGMVVKTEKTSEKVKAAQKDVMEFLLVDHPIDCPICDQAGECKLQDFYMGYDAQPSRVPLDAKLHKPKRTSFSDQIVYDAERCILCTRCVRFCNEVTKTGELGMFNRGAVSSIGLQEGRQLSSEYQGNLADICPVGALTHQDFRFKKRVWFLSSSKSVCAGCSKGCNIEIDYDEEQVFRYRPRFNADVNQYWMCDEGRLSYKSVHAEGRALVPCLRRGAEKPERSDWKTALERTASVLALLSKQGGSASVAAVGSPLASTEENYLLKRLWNAAFPGAPVAFPPETLYHEGKGDKLLKTPDKSPNASAGKALGILATSLDSIISGIEQGRVKGLYLLAGDLLERRGAHAALADRLEKAIPKLSWLAVQSPFLHATARLAHAVLPSAHFAECEGTFINTDHRVQRFSRSIPPPVEARPGIDILRDLALHLGQDLPAGGAAHVFDHLAASEKAFQGLSWKNLGDQGASLPR